MATHVVVLAQPTARRPAAAVDVAASVFRPTPAQLKADYARRMQEEPAAEPAAAAVAGALVDGPPLPPLDEEPEDPGSSRKEPQPYLSNIRSS